MRQIQTVELKIPMHTDVLFRRTRLGTQSTVNAFTLLHLEIWVAYN